MPHKLPTSRQLKGDRYADNRQQREREYLKRIERDSPDQALARAIRSSRRWQKMRDYMLNAFPLCVDPMGRHKKGGQSIEADEVHHIVPIAKAPDKAFEPMNLAPLCVSCHRAVEKKGAGGGPKYDRMWLRHKEEVKKMETDQRS